MKKETFNKLSLVVKKYDNTERFVVACQYAPEIRHHALFIAN